MEYVCSGINSSLEAPTNLDPLPLPRTSQKSRLEVREYVTFSVRFSGLGEVVIRIY